MQFQVPQFIEIEDKIFGPFTFKQFIYMAGGAGICIVIYTFLPLFFAILLILPVAIFSLALAFYKINNKPFIGVVESAFTYALSNKLYLWKKEAPKPSDPKKLGEGKIPVAYVPRLSDSKLKEIAWALDVHKELK